MLNNFHCWPKIWVADRRIERKMVLISFVSEAVVSDTWFRVALSSRARKTIYFKIFTPRELNFPYLICVGLLWFVLHNYICCLTEYLGIGCTKILKEVFSWTQRYCAHIATQTGYLSLVTLAGFSEMKVFFFSKIIYILSLGALRAPTFSWRPFGPLDFGCSPLDIVLAIG